MNLTIVGSVLFLSFSLSMFAVYLMAKKSPGVAFAICVASLLFFWICASFEK
jgi:hypothetical protein